MLSRFSSHRLRAAASKDAVNRISKNNRPAISTHFRRHEIWHSTPTFATVQEIKFRSFSSVRVADGNNGKTIEEQYSKKTPLEHVLLRPGMYIGPVERLPPNHCWVLEPTPTPPLSPTSAKNVATPAYRMVQKEYGLIPALTKIFDEILVNASDNRLRSPRSCTRLDVVIDPGSKDRDPFISIRNNGKGIPIQIHKEENMYVPEMLFGHLLTGSNFDDNEKRLTGGRHGYGAKLTNIFSKTFTVETLDSSKKLQYKQTWHENMTQATDPIITKLKSKPKSKDYTCVSFVPDMPRLTGDPNATAMDAQDYAIMCRRVFDVAGCAAGKLQVTLNGQDVSRESYASYTNMYRKEGGPQMCFSNINARWTVGVGLSNKNSFDSISFVNAMATPRGGTHVNVIVNQVVKKIQEKVSKSDPDLAETLTPGLIRRNLFVSCNTLIENPSFDSQMKEYLTSNPSRFGSSYNLTERYLNDIVQSEKDGGPGIVEEVIRVAKGRQQANLLKIVGGKKTKRQLLAIPKLEDAHHAGSNQSLDCALLLTEGDSAKALAVAGLEAIGRSKYGVFPLRGKFLNVRHATVDQLAKNGEVKALISILGLDFDKEYDTLEERSELRYGHVMLMTDQDNDGSHIKGLVINFFRHFWPKLLKPAVDQPLDRPFLSSFVTPLLKVTRKGTKETHSFYSLAEYNAWRASLENEHDVKLWNIKYYKGLGTSTPAEAKEYFAAFDKHHRPFVWNSELDGELLDKIFDKTRAADRRDWILNEYDADATVIVDPEKGNSVSYKDFVNKEMIHFSNADNIRSLPSAVDGLKPSQRKVLYACFKRKLKSEIKVAQLSGYCAEHTAYHHGEASLQGTIIGMAQDYVGSNNINLLVPSGQFGTRLAGGEDAASPRYIFTHLSPVARHLFPEDDDILLQYLEDDGQMIEPQFFCPIIPLLIVNGSHGIGTGWSTFVPPHDPRSVLDYIRAKLENKQTMPAIEPYARGFSGVIEREADGRGYVSYGRVEQIDNKTVLIDELPIGTWTNSYKAQLLSMQNKADIIDFEENHTTTKVSFKVQLKPFQLSKMKKDGLEKSFKLKSNLLLTNMNAFDSSNSISKFDSAEAIADAYFPTRMSLYHDRKSVLQSEMNYTATILRNKARFIEAVSEGEVDLIGGRCTKEDTANSLRSLGFASVSELETIRNNNSLNRDFVEEGGASASVVPDESIDSHFDYLLKMPLSSLQVERIEGLQREATKTEKELHDIKTKRPEDLWMTDLEKLAPHL